LDGEVNKALAYCSKSEPPIRELNRGLEVRTHMSVIEKRSGPVFAGSDVFADAEAVR
jgi:hypothetical protein